MITDKEIRRVLSEKKEGSQIARELGISQRSWRRIVREYNDQFEAKERLIISDQEGYELTASKKLIAAYALQRISHAVSELKNGKKILKALSEKNQLKIKGFEKEDVDLIDTVMKMEV